MSAYLLHAQEQSLSHACTSSDNSAMPCLAAQGFIQRIARGAQTRRDSQAVWNFSRICYALLAPCRNY